MACSGMRTVLSLFPSVVSENVDDAPWMTPHKFQNINSSEARVVARPLSRERLRFRTQGSDKIFLELFKTAIISRRDFGNVKRVFPAVE